MTPNRSIIFCALAFTTACVAEEDAVEDTTSETTQAITSFGNFGWIQSSEGVDLGSADNKTCFITGIRGSLKGYSIPSSSTYTTAKVEVKINPSNNHWVVTTANGNGGGVQVQVGCINYVASRKIISWREEWASSPGPVSWAPFNRDTACFFTAVSGTGWGWTAYLDNQPNPPPGVSLNFSNGKAFITGSLVKNPSGENSGTATAVCIDIPFSVDKRWTATGPGEAVLPVATPTQTGCGLQGIGGVFTGSTSTGFWLTNPGVDWKIKLTSSAFWAHPYCVW
jgi:hypothetical protein